MENLNKRQQRFCDEYLIDLNATQAAIRAGYSEKYAHTNASKLLQNTTIKEYIEKRQQDRIERTEITQDDVIKELSLIAFANATDYSKVVEKPLMVQIDGKMIQALDDNGKPIMYKTVENALTDELSEEQQRALSVIKLGKTGLVVQPHDKVKALELLGKHLGLFTDKVEMSGKLDTNPFANLTTEELKELIDSE